MSAVLGPQYDIRLFDSTLVSTRFVQSVPCVGKVSLERFVAAGCDGDRWLLACYEADGTQVGDVFEWPSYATGQIPATTDLYLLGVDEGVFAVVAAYLADYDESDPDAYVVITRVVLVDWSGDAPTLGTPYDLTNADPYDAFEWRPMAANTATLLFTRTRWVLSSYDSAAYFTLQRSGLALSAGGTAALTADRTGGRSTIHIGGGWWADATTGETDDVPRIQLVATSGATVNVWGETTVTGLDDTWRWTARGFGSGALVAISQSDEGVCVIPNRTGTTPTWTKFDLPLLVDTATATAPMDGYQIALAVEAVTVSDGVDYDPDPPDYNVDPGDLYVVQGNVSITSAVKVRDEAPTRDIGGMASTYLSPDRIIVAWSETDLDTASDCLIRIQPIISASDTTGVDDVTSVMTNWLGGDILATYFTGQDTYLALLTGDPTALGSTAAEVVGGDYERLLCDWTTPGTKTIGLGALRFVNMPACTVSWLAVMDAAVGGHMLIAKALPVPITVPSSAEFRLAANAIVLTL